MAGIFALTLSAHMPHPVIAQRPHRSGLWVELGLGPSLTRVSCSDCSEVTRGSGPVGSTRVGLALSDRVMLGLEIASQVDTRFGFTSTDSSGIARNETFAIIVLWYPWDAGLFLKGGTGVATGEITVEPDAVAPSVPIVSIGEGVGMTFGVGWDFTLSRHIALTANATSWISAIGDIVLSDGAVEDVIASRYGLTIGLTIR